MTSPKPQAPAPAPLIPNCAPPARRKYAASWSPAEREFIEWLMAAWNDTVGKVGSSAYHVRLNHSAAVFFYRRIHQSAGASPAFTRDAIRRALELYAAAEANRKLQSWKRFHDFFSVGEDMIDGLLRKAGVSPRLDDSRRAAAQKIADHLGLVRVARSAAQSNVCMLEYAQTQCSILERRISPTTGRPRDIPQHNYWSKVARLCDDWTYKLAPKSQDAYRARAARCFAALYDRPPQPHTCNAEDDTIVFAIALALFDLETGAEKARSHEATEGRRGSPEISTPEAAR